MDRMLMKTYSDNFPGGGWGVRALFALALMLFAVYPSGMAAAQQAETATPQDEADLDEDMADTDAAVAEIIGDQTAGGDAFPSLFFTREERRAIELALEEGNVLDVTEIPNILGEEECLTCALEDGPGGEEDTGPKVPTGPREIKLAGVLYFSAYDWTIWLNGERVTPYFIPDEVIKLDVTRNNVYIEWFDEFYDRILRVNLKPHQTFYMDANVILPNQPSP